MEGLNKALGEDEQVEPGTTYFYDEATILPPLLASPNRTNLRVFKLGFSDSSDLIGHSTMVNPFGNCNIQQVIELLQKCPRLEELYLNAGLRNVERLFALPALGNLRVLQYYYGMDSG